MVEPPDEPPPPRVLVVDDDPLMRKSVVRTLRRAGVAVDEAASGGEALGLAMGGRYAVLVTDLEMPGMTGFELLAALTDRGSDLPVILMSGHPIELERVAQLAGDRVRGALDKPFSSDELLAAVRHALRR